jgi:O-acetyl-ADP-ribose deacetylase (regulator of RNase III)
MPEPTIERGDITKVDVDAIVNAANVVMLGGGGVDHAIHAAAGPELLEACRRVPAVDGIRCPFGEARITPGFRLLARFVIHTVGPIHGRTPEPELVLRRAYDACLQLAHEHGLRSIAFPAISAGSYGFPLDSAASIAIEAARAHHGVEQVRFVLFERDAHEAFERALAKSLPGPV